jgi:hypothetical protein
MIHFPVATPTAATQGVPVGQTVAASALFSAFDADGDAIAVYRFWDDGAGGGFFRVNGVPKSAGQAIDVSAADLANTVYVGGASPGSETVWVRLNDGTLWGEWVNWRMVTQRVNNVLPVVDAPATRNIDVNQWVRLSEFVNVADADGDPIVKFELHDLNNAAGTSYLWANGMAQPQGVDVEANVSNLTDTWVRGGTAPGTETIEIRANDGFGWGEWESFDVATRQPNRLPVVTAQNRSVRAGQAVGAGTLFDVTDADNDAIAEYRFYDEGTDPNSGYFSLGGTRQTAGVTFTVPAVQLANLQWVSGTGAGSETVWARASDGQGYGAWASWTMTTTPNRAPVVAPSAPMQGALVNQLVSAAGLFSGSDPDGDTIQLYEFWDSGAAQSSGYFDYLQEDNSRLRMLANTAIAVNPLTLMFLSYRGGAVAGTETVWVRANDGTAWGEWVSWSMVTRAANALPVVDAPATRNSDLNQWQRLSEFVTVADADADAIVRFELRDLNHAAGSGYLWANGAAQPQGVDVVTHVSNLTDTWVRGGTGLGTDTIEIRANDGFGWGDWESFDLVTRFPNRAPVATPTAPFQGVTVGQPVAAATLFGTTDLDGDAIAIYRFWDGGAGGGFFRVNGNPQGAQQGIDVSAANLANTAYVGGANPGSETLWVRVNDGTAWSEWVSWQMLSIHANNAAPVVSGLNQYLLTPNQWIDVNTVEGLNVTDPDGDALLLGRIVDDTATAGSGYLWFAGSSIPAGQIVTFTQADLDAGRLWARGGATTGTDQYRVSYSDGALWSDWLSISVQTRASNQAPTVTAADAGIGLNQSRPASQLFSVGDADQDQAQLFQFWDSGTAGTSGRFTLNGMAQPANQAIEVLPANLAQAQYAGGSAAGSETVWARAFDGGAWSAWKSWQMTTLA